MATAHAAEQAAEAYLQTHLSAPIRDSRLVGMTMSPHGHRLGVVLELDRGTSVARAILLGIAFGLFFALLGFLLRISLLLIGIPGLGELLFIVLTGLGGYLGMKNGYRVLEEERVTLTVDDQGNVVTINRDLSAGEFNRAIDRQYDRQTDQVEHAVFEVSKHLALHKLLDRFLGRGNK